jgi:hypothetical protein
MLPPNVKAESQNKLIEQLHNRLFECWYRMCDDLRSKDVNNVSRVVNINAMQFI